MKRNIKKVVVSVVIVIVAMLLLVASIIGIRKLRQSMFQPEKVVEENMNVEEVVPTEEVTPSEEVTPATEEEPVSEDATSTDEEVEEEEPVDPNVTYTNPWKEGQEMHASEDNVYVPERRELPERLQKLIDESEPMSEEEYAEFYREKMEYEAQLRESEAE